MPAGVPLLLEIEPSQDIDWIITSLGLEIVAEEEDGYVIVASSDINFEKLREVLENFEDKGHGTGSLAKVYKIEDEQERLKRILSPTLWNNWPNLKDSNLYTVDVSIECAGQVRLPPKPERTDKDTDQRYQGKLDRWQRKIDEANMEWDEIFEKREESLLKFVRAYNGEIHHLRENAARTLVKLPDCLEARLEISGQGLRDLVQNFPFLFEVTEPPEIELVPEAYAEGEEARPYLRFLPPDDDAPTVAIVDSGIQEEHRFLAAAINKKLSISLVPREEDTFADFVKPAGHGTRVAGAVLFGENIPEQGEHQLPFWVQNVRVLNKDCSLSKELHPPSYLEHVVQRRNGTRIFNHSINTRYPCRLKHISAWAATMDQLSYEHDVLFIQSAGNIAYQDNRTASLGVLDHLQAGRPHPRYLVAKSCRIASPAEGLQALVVGSISYPDNPANGLSLGEGPSGFSRSGYGPWNTLRPDVVEYGGDWCKDEGNPPHLKFVEGAAPPLLRSTLHEPGPPHARDVAGTSFAAPKVTRLAAELQRLLPSEPCLLYRALIANSARWPKWAEDNPSEETIRMIGYGRPDPERALSNTPYRVTLISSGLSTLSAGQAHVYQIVIPEEIQNAAAEQRIRIDVTLSYAARPRRTRRYLKRYLSTWLDWDVSKANESRDSFLGRILKEVENGGTDGETIFPWVIRERGDYGTIQGHRRNQSTLQKDWAVLPAHQLPEDFCLAVIGHRGWSKCELDAAKYALAISFEALDGDLEIYQPIRVALDNVRIQSRIVV
ncbi:MAG: S8 family peptidase [Vulcanimicrobiota bacterium]